MPSPPGPYPATLTGSPITLFFCLSGSLVSNWDTSYAGTESEPSTTQEEEAAYLVSLFLTDAAADGITLTTSVAGNGYESLTETATGAMDLSTFINTVQGPITMAIWEIMGSLPSESPYGVTLDDPNAAPFVSLAEADYSSSLNPYTVVFVPTNLGIQTFIGVAVPEPGTLVLFGTGALLLALGCARRLARRPR